jgi:dCTP deaminase
MSRFNRQESTCGWGASSGFSRQPPSPHIDTREEPQDYTKAVRVEGDQPFIMDPGEFVLGIVMEYVKLPGFLMGSVDWRSSLGRLGITIQATSASINPGWEERFVLEISNMGKMPVALYPGMRVAKLTLHKLSSPAEKPYGETKGAKYQGQDGVDGSKIHDNSQL